jgi:hypothetical protein
MQYTLITATGKLYTFFVLAVAETYQQGCLKFFLSHIVI